MSIEGVQLRDFPEPGVAPERAVDSGWWFSVAAYAVAVFVIVFPPDPGTWIRRTITAAVFTIGSFVLVWVARLGTRRLGHLRTRWVKGAKYDALYELAATRGRRLESSHEFVRLLLRTYPSYTAATASVYQGKLMLEFAKKGRRNLPLVGVSMQLFDCESGHTLGTFKVAQCDGKTCQVVDQGDVDPLFHGYAINEKAFLPENIALFALPEKEENDE